MDVFRFAIRRLLISIPVLFVASVLVFVMVANSGDPLSNLNLNPKTPAATKLAREQELHLLSPTCTLARFIAKSCPAVSVVSRYRIWITHFVTGNFGQTITGEPVRPLLQHRLWVTIRMVFLAMLLAIILAVLFGVVSAVRQYSMLDYGATFAGFLLLATPVYFFATLLKIGGIKFNLHVHHTYFFTLGESTPNLTGNILSRYWNAGGHLILPTLALAGISFAAWSRFQRASMLDVLGADYVRLARAKGLTPRRVLVRHALRTALIPLTTVVAIDFGAIFGGAILTEKVFDWKGMGDLLVTGVTNRDINTVLAWLMVSAVIIVLFNLVADILYGVLDPRIR